MPRSLRTGQLEYNPEIEKEAKRLRKETRLRRGQTSTSNVAQDIQFDTSSGTDIETEPSPNSSEVVQETPPTVLETETTLPYNQINPQTQPMDGKNPPPERTLRQMMETDLTQTPIGIQYPENEGGMELKSSLVHHLPTFHGLENENPHKHLAILHLICSSMKPQGTTDDQIKLRAFPFSLADRARDWLLFLPPGSINTWNEMARAFLDKFYPATRASSLRNEICGIKQRQEESFHDYWERFNNLCISCPQHQIPETLLIQHFYEGLLPMERRLVDASSGGDIFNKTALESIQLFKTMAANSQHFGPRQDMRRDTIHKVNEVDTNTIESKLEKLTMVVQQLASDKIPKAVVCGICATMGHHTDECPVLQEDAENVNAMGGYQGHQQRPSGYQAAYNSSWKPNPNPNYVPKALPQNALTRPQYQHHQAPYQQPHHHQSQYHQNQYHQHRTSSHPSYQQPQ